MFAAQTPAVRRYNRRLMVVMIGYVVSLFGANWMLAHWHPQGTALAAIAILPALPIVGVLVVIGRYLVEERDEFLRQRSVTAMLVGLGFMLAISTVLGFLNEAGVVPAVPGYYAFVLWCLGWGVAQGVLSLRDRAAGQRA